MTANKGLSEQVKQKALELGFLECAILRADSVLEEKQNYLKWLSQKRHGQMSYMERNIDKRFDPRLLFENAKTIIVVLQNYYPQQTQNNPEAPVLSKYAYGTDYHFVIKDKLRKMLTFIQAGINDCSGRPFVDSAPVLERAWAKKAGLGWIGKNSNLISAQHGSFFFIGELIIDKELVYDQPRPATDRCGTCTRCIDACPTKAIITNRVVDARKCISYQTIEIKGDIDEKLKGQFNNRVFGCDICQDVCPWNLKAQVHNEPAFSPHPKLLQLTPNEWENMERPLFNELFKNSAVKRAGYKGLKRNIAFLKNEPQI